MNNLLIKKNAVDFLIAVLLTGSAFIHGCKEYTEEPFATLPIVTTLSPGLVLINTVEMSGEVTDESGLAVTLRGFCWSKTNQFPTLDDDSLVVGKGEGNFSATIMGLSGESTYFIRAFANTKKGTGYGAVLYVKTADTTVTDIENNTYKAIQIGNRIWMAENLRVTRFRNGDPIPNVTDNTTWINLSNGVYCWYENDEATNKNTYGAIYNWFVLSDNRHLAPGGWHVASVYEWQALVDTLGGGLIAGGKLKETGITHWASPNIGATNEFGFTALPGGFRHSVDGIFKFKGGMACWWSILPDSETNAYYTRIYNFSAGIESESVNKTNGFSVRCVRD